MVARDSNQGMGELGMIVKFRSITCDLQGLPAGSRVDTCTFLLLSFLNCHAIDFHPSVWIA